MMKGYKLNHIDPEEIGDLLVKVERSFDIQVGRTELMYISTFGEVCDLIAGKIQLDHADDCTSQQAFYKLRDAISSTLQVDRKAISTNALLTDLLPTQNRRSRIKKLEKHVGFKLNMLRPPYWGTGALTIVLLISLVGLFSNWPIALAGCVFSIAGLGFAAKLGNELDLQTIGQVVEKMTRENYVQSRRNPRTFNKNEIEKIITNWFCDELGLDKSTLTRKTTFV
jgi:acyl carrier protein